MSGAKQTIYKIATREQWDEATVLGIFKGAPVDIEDGFIHFSTAEQVKETAEKHFNGQKDLLLVSFEAEMLGGALKWEPSRGGALFPHFYGLLDISLATTVHPLTDREDGRHDFPESM